MSITEDQFRKHIQVLASKGLNIFGSIEVSSLPEELRDELPLPIENMGHLCLIGSGGPLMWTNIKAPHNHESNPVDTYVETCVNDFAKSVFGETAPVILYPRSDLIFPLQQLGRLMGLAKKTPLGIDLHQQFGLWFAYRSLLWSIEDLPLVQPTQWASPCDTCADKPCISSCPAQAVTAEGFKGKNCAQHRMISGSSCADKCFSRLACPYQANQRYTDEQLRYHMSQPDVLEFLGRYK